MRTPCGAESGATIQFHQVHEPSGKRIKYEKVVPGIGPVDTDEIIKGFEYEKGEYVLLDEKEIEGVKLESKKTLELTQFVDADEIDVLYYEKPYFVVPADDLAEEAFIVLREAPAGEQGGASAALSLTDSLGTALGTGVTGALVAASVRADGSAVIGLAVGFALAVAIGLVALAASGRLRPAAHPFGSVSPVSAPGA